MLQNSASFRKVSPEHWKLFNWTLNRHIGFWVWKKNFETHVTNCNFQCKQFSSVFLFASLLICINVHRAHSFDSRPFKMVSNVFSTRKMRANFAYFFALHTNTFTGGSKALEMNFFWCNCQMAMLHKHPVCSTQPKYASKKTNKPQNENGTDCGCG